MESAASTTTICTICLTAVGPGDQAAACPDCSAVYHEDCWQDNGGCGVYGCKSTPAVETRQGLEIPMSHWGKEQKHCPSCGFLIQAAAVRCRHCGNTFEANPLEAAAFRQRRAQTDRLPGVRRMAVILAVLCLFPLTAPIGVLIGLVWLPLKWRDLSALPSLYRTLCCVGFIVALVIIIGLVLLTQAYQHTDHQPLF
jgi:hypothetical protein